MSYLLQINTLRRSWNKLARPVSQLRFRSQPAPQEQFDANNYTNEELVALIEDKVVPHHRLEKELDSNLRATTVRRSYVSKELETQTSTQSADSLNQIPLESFDYEAFYNQIDGANCENVIGYLPVPLGLIGPVTVDSKLIHIPMATTEGALVASTNRGCRAISLSGGALTSVLKNGMTRAPLVRFSSAQQAANVAQWLHQPENQKAVSDAFNSTTNFGKLEDVTAHVAGRNAFLRFRCFTGDAMGMNMVSKGTLKALEIICEAFPDAEVVSLSGNVCADKKAAAINWVQGRGRSVVCETILKKDVVEKVLKTSVDKMIQVNINKNLVGSAVAGSLGGFNAHASNIVAAVFLATGNDIAQVVESSQCITLLEQEGEDLHVSVSMPAIEVGTVGGGTGLPAQANCLGVIGCQGSNKAQPGQNADQLARAVAVSVMAGEISLIAALASNHLVDSHLKLNRKPVTSANPSGVRSMHTHAFHTNITPQMATSFGDPSSGGPKLTCPPEIVPCTSFDHMDGKIHETFMAKYSNIHYDDDEDFPRLPVP